MRLPVRYTHARALDLSHASRSDRTLSVTQIGCRGRRTQTCIGSSPSGVKDRIRQKKGNACTGETRDKKRVQPKSRAPSTLLTRIGTSALGILTRRGDDWSYSRTYKDTPWDTASNTSSQASQLLDRQTRKRVMQGARGIFLPNSPVVSSPAMYLDLSWLISKEPDCNSVI